MVRQIGKRRNKREKRKEKREEGKKREMKHLDFCYFFFHTAARKGIILVAVRLHNCSMLIEVLESVMIQSTPRAQGNNITLRF